MKKLAALLALAPAAPAVACDHAAAVSFSSGYAVAAPVALAAPCVCPDPNAFAASSVQTYSAPAVTLAPVVQSYPSAVVALPTVTHSYAAASFGASSGYGAFSSGHDAYSLAQLQGQRRARIAVALARFGNHSPAAVAARHNVAARNRAFNRGFAAGRRAAPRRAARREGIVTRALRAPGRILGGLFGR